MLGRQLQCRAALVLSLGVVASACTDRSVTAGNEPDATAGPQSTPLDVPSLRIDLPRGRRPWDGDATALVAAIRAAGGNAVVAFKNVESKRLFDAAGLRAAINRRSVDRGLDLLRSRGIEVTGLLRSIGAAQVRFADPEAAVSLRAHALVDFIEPRQQLNLTSVPAAVAGVAGGPGLAAFATPTIQGSATADLLPWGVSMIRADQVWSVTRGDNVKVMLLVPGGPAAHNDYATIDPNRCGGASWHVCDGWEGTGTFMVGQLGSQQNGWGIVGVAPGLPTENIYAWNPCFQSSQDPTAVVCYDDGMAQGLDAAVLIGAKVFNFGNFAWHATDSPTLSSAIARAWSANVVMLASVGTDNAYTNDVRPAIYPNVIGVSGIRMAGDFASSSSCTNANGGPFGSSYGPLVDVAAPFEGWGTWPTNSYQYFCGGANTVDYATGVVMLIRSANPTWTAQQVVDRLFATAKECGPAGRDDQYGYGIVDAAAAVGVAARQSCVPPLQVTADAPGLVRIKGTYQLSGSASQPVSSWLWERSDDGGPFTFWSNSQNTAFVAYAGNYTIAWRLTATRASDGTTATTSAETRVCIPYSASTCQAF